MTVLILSKGAAIITRNIFQKVTINIHSIGVLFGKVFFLTQTPRSTNIFEKSRAKVLKLDSEMLKKHRPATRDKLKDEFISVLINRVSQMNTALVRLKAEMEAINHVAMDYQDELDRFLKPGKTMKEIFGGIQSTINTLIR